MKKRLIFVFALGLLVSGACSGPDTPERSVEGSFQRNLQTRLITASPGDIIEIPSGIHEITRGLSLNVSGVTIRGAGMDHSVLSFRNQVQGAEGLLVTASDFTIEDLAIEDTRGDALKINEGNNIVIRRVRTEWTSGPDEENGAYGIYPVQTTNVLLEDSVAIGASDAGIYVGQSTNVIVRNNLVELNVAGIEIENTVNADVYGNIATNNTGGILVFDMPDLPMSGHSSRIYGNTILSNNTDNFGAEGTPVASVPAGSGIVINSGDRIEIFDNDIADNDTANIIISSYYATGYQGQYDVADVYDPYPESIYIYGNRFSGGGESPDGLELQALRVAVFGIGGRFPDILWDGYVNADKTDDDGNLLPEYAICVENGDVDVLNVDLPNGSANIVIGSDQHNCQQNKLTAVELSTAGP
jgi:parallel beta-helix repeat protein